MVNLREMTEQGLEVEIERLPDNTLFRISQLGYVKRAGRQTVEVTGWTYGVKLWHNASRARVRMDGEQQIITFGDEGQRRQFTSSGAVEQNYPLGIGVVPVFPDTGGDEYAGNLNEHGQHIEGRAWRHDMGNTTAVDQKVVNALNARYKHAMGQLTKAVESGDAAKIEMAQGRVDTILKESQAAGVTVGDEAAPTGAGEKMAAVAKKSAGKRTTAGEVAQTKDANLAAADKARAAKGTAKKEAKVKEPKLPTTRDCLCGCGLETGGLFRPGHDARVKGWLYNVERGTYPGGAAALPETLKPHVKFAGTASTAGKDNSNYRVVSAPVKFPGRPEVALTEVK